MMNGDLFKISFAAILYCCNPGSGSSQVIDNAKRLNNAGIFLYARHPSNDDSLKVALDLVDSAISLSNDVNFYYNKYIILRRLHRFRSALSVCDSILSRRKYDYRANLYKGYLYEDLGNIDSSRYFYKKTMALVDDPRYFNAQDIVKDQQKIILLGLLRDTLEFQRKVQAFEIKYAGTKYFDDYMEEFRHFNREIHLNKL